MRWAVSILSAERLRSGVCTPREGALMVVGGSQGLQKLHLSLAPSSCLVGGSSRAYLWLGPSLPFVPQPGTGSGRSLGMIAGETHSRELRCAVRGAGGGGLCLAGLDAASAWVQRGWPAPASSCSPRFFPLEAGSCQAAARPLVHHSATQCLFWVRLGYALLKPMFLRSWPLASPPLQCGRLQLCT